MTGCQYGARGPLSSDTRSVFTLYPIVFVHSMLFLREDRPGKALEPIIEHIETTFINIEAMRKVKLVENLHEAGKRAVGLGKWHLTKTGH